MKTYYVYIMASNRKETLYTGVTDNLLRRVQEHKSSAVQGFTKKYDVHRLVYYEPTNSVETAIKREKKLKKWERDWKLALIEKTNPKWRDLYKDLF